MALMLHAATGVATSSRRPCYISPPPLLHATVAQSAAVATSIGCTCYIISMSLLHHVVVLATLIRGVATCGHLVCRRCYRPLPLLHQGRRPCYIRPPTLLQATGVRALVISAEDAMASSPATRWQHLLLEHSCLT
jgi:hypothetical protein